MKSVIATVLCAGIVLSGCATSSKDIATAYVSPIQYQGYDCAQITAENQRLNTRVTQLGGRLDEAAANDKAIGVVGAVLFWPALFALGGTKNQEAEYARLKGEYDALQQVAIEKKCMASAAAPTPAPAAIPTVAPAPAAPAVPAAEKQAVNN